MSADRLILLQASRDLLVDALNSEDVKPVELAQLSRELRAVLADIDKIPGSGEVTPLDKLADDLEERRRRRKTG
jgi:hypothetical protein